MSTTIATNKKAYHDYFVIEKWDAGIELVGSEVKAIRKGRANLKDSYIRIINGEAWLMGMHISHLESANPYYRPDETRVRRLLLHRKEIPKLHNKSVISGMTIVPLSLYLNDRNLVKLQIALAQGKEGHDKREDLKKKTALREAQQEMKKYR